MVRSHDLAAAEKGGSNELRFFSAFQAPVWRPPFWYIDCRRATRDEDRAGVDAFVSIDAGVIPVQIKSSFEGLRRDALHYGHEHCIIVVSSRMSPEEIRSKSIDLFYRWRGKLIRTQRAKARR